MRQSKQNKCEQAAKLVIETMETPEKLLAFLMDAGEWVYNSDVKRGKPDDTETFFDLNALITNLVIPWIYCKGKNEVGFIANGFKALNDDLGFNHIYNMYMGVMNAFADDLGHSIPSGSYFKVCSKGITMLYEMYELLKEEEVKEAA